MLKSRLQKLANGLKPEATKLYYMGWADCTWSESEGLLGKLMSLKRTSVTGFTEPLENSSCGLIRPKESPSEYSFHNQSTAFIW